MVKKMSSIKFLIFIPFAYLIWWFYTLFSWLIPLTSTLLVDLNLSMVFSIILFIVLGGLGVFYALAFIFAFLSVEN